MTATVGVDTYGLQAALKKMQKIDPALRRTLLNEIKAAADPVVSTINARVPASPPLSGMKHNGRTGWSKVKKVQVFLNTRKPRSSPSRPGTEQISVIRIVTKDTTLAITDMAGRAGGNKSRVDTKNRRPDFASKLDARLGPASRFMWRDIELLQMEAQKGLKPIIEKLMADAQKDFA